MALDSYLSQFVPPADASVLMNANDWLVDEEFWPAFLRTVGGSITAAKSFAAGPSDVQEYCKKLHEYGSWPFLSVELPHGNQLHILFRNYEGESGWDYLMQPAGARHVVMLAALEGHFQGPGLSWPELLAVADEGTTSLRRAQRLLLVLPATADNETPKHAVTLVAHALAKVGAEEENRLTVAAELLGAADSFWGSRVAWQQIDGYWVCPKSLSRSHRASLEQRNLFREAFSAP